MRRPIFLSFCYKDDVFRVQQIIKMGVVEGQQLLSPNDFETVKRRGDAAIKNWIDDQLKNKQCLVVLIGSNTANRPYVQYEIKKAHEKNMPMFGIYIHDMKDINGNKSIKGENPFIKALGFDYGYKCIDPINYSLYPLSTYNIIESNISSWIEDAISRNRNSNGSIFF